MFIQSLLYQKDRNAIYYRVFMPHRADQDIARKSQSSMVSRTY